MMARRLGVISREILADWKKVNFAAKPYLDAMCTLGSIDDMYMFESGREIVTRFLINASTWRGEVARRVKLELKNMLETQRGRDYGANAP